MSAALLAGLLAGVFVAAAYVQKAYVSVSAARDLRFLQSRHAALLRARQEVQARRTGSILWEYPGEPCEELRFDNYTGAFLSMAVVDCNAAPSRAAESPPANDTATMRNVLASFKR
mgnify:FL=1